MTVNSTNTAAIIQFKDTIHSVLEQKGSKARTSVKVELAQGEKHMFERLASFTASEITSSRQPTNLQDALHTRRMATVRLYEASTSLDDLDDIKMMIDPTHDYTVKLARAHGRNLDTIIFDAMLGTASTGKDGTGTQTLGAGQQIAHGSTGFTVAKFNAALRIMEAAEVDVDGTRLYLALAALGVEDLMGENSIISVDYQNEKALSNGTLPRFRGVNIMRTQILAHETAGTTYRGILYTEDAVRVAIAKDMVVNTGLDPSLNFLPVINTKMAFGAVRMEEELVVDVLYQ